MSDRDNVIGGWRRWRGKAGFTLIEILVVMLVLSILMGVGIGFLSRLDTSLDNAIATVRDQVRHAREVARNRTSPARVVFEKGKDGLPATIHSVVLAPVGQWHFEDNSGRGAPDHPGQIIGGKIVEEGRFGRCLQVDQEVGKHGLICSTKGVAAFDLSSGFKVRVDVLLEKDQPCTVLALTKTFSIGVRQGLLPTAELFLEGTDGASGPVHRLTATRPIELRSWTTLEASYDRVAFRLAVNGFEVASMAATARPFQDPNADLVVSDAGASVPGRIDECFLLAYEKTDATIFETEVDLLEAPSALQFDARGEPDPRAHPGPIRIVLGRGPDRKTLTLEPGGILR